MKFLVGVKLWKDIVNGINGENLASRKIVAEQTLFLHFNRTKKKNVLLFSHFLYPKSLQ